MAEQHTITLDVRDVPPRERHPRIFDTFAELPLQGVIRLVNDHDPKPLYYQFQAEHPGEVEWEYQEQGPDTWVVCITKVREGAAPD